jgi:hypothetical protein
MTETAHWIGFPKEAEGRNKKKKEKQEGKKRDGEVKNRAVEDDTELKRRQDSRALERSTDPNTPTREDCYLHGEHSPTSLPRKETKMVSFPRGQREGSA